MKILIPLLLIGCLFSCKKKEVEEEEVVECETPVADSTETQKILKIEIGHDNYEDFLITINDVEKEGSIFPVETGDKVYVLVTNNCWTETHYGLGDTIGMDYTQCTNNEIAVYLNNVYVNGDYCYPQWPTDGCPQSYDVNYIVE